MFKYLNLNDEKPLQNQYSPTSNKINLTFPKRYFFLLLAPCISEINTYYDKSFFYVKIQRENKNYGHYNFSRGKRNFHKILYQTFSILHISILFLCNTLESVQY